jgi:hypothetical protein
MKPLPQTLRDRLAKLLPRLGSPFAGERIATLEAIDRVLRAEGCDLHDLTHAIAVPARANGAASQQQRKPPTSERKIDGDELHEIVERLRRANERQRFLNERSCEFLDSLLHRCERYTVVFLSAKQAAWLSDLETAAGRAR